MILLQQRRLPETDDHQADVTVVRQLAASGERLAKTTPTSVAARLIEDSQAPIALEAMDERDHDAVAEATTADDGEGPEIGPAMRGLS